MSIINDALKKVQRDLSHSERKGPPQVETNPEDGVEKSTIAQLPPAPALQPTPPPPSAPAPQVVQPLASGPSDIQAALTRAENTSTIQAADNRSPTPTATILATPMPEPVKAKPQQPPFSPDKFFAKFKSAPKPAPRPKTALTAAQKRQDRVLTAISMFICAALVLCIFVLINQYIQIHKPKGVINGVMQQGNKNVVLIDNEVYEVGDVYSGARIVAITIDKVQFLENGILRTVKVKNTRQK